MASGFEVVIKQTLIDQGCLIVAHWIGATGVTARILCDVLGTYIMPALQGIMSNSVKFDGMTVTNLSDEGDKATLLFTDVFGARSGNTLPVHDALGYEKVRQTDSTRNGAMRLAGISETDQNGGVLTAGFQTIVDSAGDQLASAWADAGSNVIFPAILGRRLPALPDVLNLVNDYVFKRVTTQNSRKGYTNSNVSLPLAGDVTTVTNAEMLLLATGYTPSKMPTLALATLGGDGAYSISVTPQVVIPLP